MHKVNELWEKENCQTLVNYTKARCFGLGDKWQKLTTLKSRRHLSES